jgi:hypothetical protein
MGQSSPDRPAGGCIRRLKTLVDQLEARGTATDDSWEYAIETMLGFANESAVLATGPANGTTELVDHPPSSQAC